LKRWLRLGHLNEIKSIPQTSLPKSTTFSTKPAQIINSKFTLRGLAARAMLQLRKFSCSFAAGKVVIQTNRGEDKRRKAQVWLVAARCSLGNAACKRVQGRQLNPMLCFWCHRSADD
jgi:hypothetical protein